MICRVRRCFSEFHFTISCTTKLNLMSRCWEVQKQRIKGLGALSTLPWFLVFASSNNHNCSSSHLPPLEMAFGLREYDHGWPQPPRLQPTAVLLWQSRQSASSPCTMTSVPSTGRAMYFHYTPPSFSDGSDWETFKVIFALKGIV